MHPSGVGVNRYIAPSRLTAEELAYLRRQGRLQFVNLVDPQLFGFQGFRMRSPFSGELVRWSAALGHMLTSFGHTLNLNLLVQQGGWDVQVIVHRYENGARSFPGLDVSVFDYPLVIGGQHVRVSPRLALWLQPEAQAFHTREAARGAMGVLQVAKPHSTRWRTFLEIEAKTAGWVAGSVSLEPRLSARAGGSLSIR